MAATVYGSLGKYGITDESSKGFYAASQSVSASNEQAFVKNHIGDDIGLATYNIQAELTQSGVTVAAASISQSLSAALDIATTDILAFGVSNAAAWIVTGMTLNRTNTDFETGEVTAIARKTMTDNTPTTVS